MIPQWRDRLISKLFDVACPSLPCSPIYVYRLFPTTEAYLHKCPGNTLLQLSQGKEIYFLSQMYTFCAVWEIGLVQHRAWWGHIPRAAQSRKSSVSICEKGGFSYSLNQRCPFEPSINPHTSEGDNIPLPSARLSRTFYIFIVELYLDIRLDLSKIM